MTRMTRLLLGAATLAALALPTLPGARADVGPRRPVTRYEVSDPQNYLAMRDESVNVTIDGKHTATVEARFHFAQMQPAWRQTLVMRLGFPQLTTDAPLQDFKVKQALSAPNMRPSSLEAVDDIKPQASGAEPSVPPGASWLTWPLVLPGSHGAPMKLDVHTVVSYAQKLTARPNKTWRYTYVLRSGAPWRESIGSAEVTVSVKSGKIVSALPKGGVITGNTVTWSLKDIEPTEDVVVTVR